LKLGIRASPQTVRRYIPGSRGGEKGPRLSTLDDYHAQAILACDFFVTVTLTFRVQFVFVVVEVGTRRIAHFNVTSIPQQTGLCSSSARSSTVSSRIGLSSTTETVSTPWSLILLKSMGVSILKMPFRAPQANASYERLIGTVRRECLDYLIPLDERHL